MDSSKSERVMAWQIWHSPLQLFFCTRSYKVKGRNFSWTLLWGACKRGLFFPSYVVLFTAVLLAFLPVPEGDPACPSTAFSPVGCCFQRGSGQVPRSSAHMEKGVLATHLATFAPLGNVISPSASERLDPVPTTFIMNSDVHLDEVRVYLLHFLHLYLQLH